MLKMLLRLMLLLSIILCAQFAQESRLEHKVLSKVSVYPFVFRIDEDFTRSYASISTNRSFILSAELLKKSPWRISKYYNNASRVNESLSIDTVVVAKNGAIALGKSGAIELDLVSYKEGESLVLQNSWSQEKIELIPIPKGRKVISQSVVQVKSSVKKFKDKETKEYPSGKVNGVELTNLELIFVRARIPKVSKKPIYNNAINGRIDLLDGGIDSGELVFDDLLRIGKASIEPIMLNYIDVNNGGQISFEYMGQTASGIFSKSGKDTYVLRIATGKLAGSSFTFAKRGSEQLQKVKKRVLTAKAAQEQAAKERSLASKRTLERSSYRF